MLAGGRLVLAGSNETALSVDPCGRAHPGTAAVARAGRRRPHRRGGHAVHRDRRRHLAGVPMTGVPFTGASRRRHCRAAQCRQEHAVQQAGRASLRHRVGHARRDARPQGGGGAAARQARAADRHRRAGGVGAGHAAGPDARVVGGGGGPGRPDRVRGGRPRRRHPGGQPLRRLAAPPGPRRCCWSPTRRRAGPAPPRRWTPTAWASASRWRCRRSMGRACPP